MKAIVDQDIIVSITSQGDTEIGRLPKGVGVERLRFVPKSTAIRGMGENELVWVLKQEFDNLPGEEKKLFGEL